MAENHWDEVSDAFIDPRQDIRIVNYLKTRTFCSGKFAISTPSTSTTGTHIYTNKNALNPAFYYDSEFYKEYLERTECTLTYDGDSTDRENWYLSTSSQSVSELIAGEDGIYRPFYESGTTGTQQWFFDTRLATNTTILIGSFEIFPKASQYQITGFAQSQLLTKATCCPCVETSNTYRDAQLSQLENVIMADDLTVGFSGICTFISETHNANIGSYEVPIYLKTKNLTQGDWGAVETISVGTHTMQLSNMALSYDRPWMLVGQPFVNQGVLEVSGKKYMNPNVFISQKEAIELHSYTGRYGQIANISKDEFANRHSHSLVVNPNNGVREDFIPADSVDLRIRRGNLPLGERYVQVQYTQFSERQEIQDFEDVDRPRIDASPNANLNVQGGAGKLHEVGSYASHNNWLKLGFGTAHTDAFIMFPQPERGDEIEEAFEGADRNLAKKPIGDEKIV